MTGMPGNVREFETRPGNVGDFVNSRGIVRGIILSWESVPRQFNISSLVRKSWLLCVLNISISFKNSAVSFFVIIIK